MIYRLFTGFRGNFYIDWFDNCGGGPDRKRHAFDRTNNFYRIK